MAAFLYAVITNRAVSVEWQHPMPFSLAFDSPNVDWSYPYTPTLQALHPIYGNRSLISKRYEVDLMNPATKFLDQTARTLRGWLYSGRKWVRVSCVHDSAASLCNIDLSLSMSFDSCSPKGGNQSWSCVPCFHFPRDRYQACFTRSRTRNLFRLSCSIFFATETSSLEVCERVR